MQINIENVTSGEKYVFECKRWLAKDEDDGAIVREMPAQGTGIKRPLEGKILHPNSPLLINTKYLFL